MATRAHSQLVRQIAPADAFARLARRRGVFWLDSSFVRSPDARYSVMGCEPRWVFSAQADAWRLALHDGRLEHGGSGALEQLDALLDAGAAAWAADATELPFAGGAVGWLAYDLGRQFETIDGTAADDLRLPDIRLAWYDAAIVWDHRSGESWLVGLDGERDAAVAQEELAAWLREPPMHFDLRLPDDHPEARSDMSRAEYTARVDAVRSGIARGEYYQLNLVQRFTCAHRRPSAATYLRLRALNPAPFAAFLAMDDGAVLSSSPERFVEITPGGDIRTCPIKGTRPRAATAADDAVHRAELLGSAKEQAELLMIVDLMRNDLGRVCVPGTVDVPRLHALESFATVHHLVGEVRGRLRPTVTRRELLRAVFPGGSITGAPKVSAMRAIDRFEPHRRGIAMGSIGYCSAHGRIDLNIAIRTIVTRRDTAYVAVGAGIVWDSEPQAEYAETLAKARALFEALGVTELET